MKQHIFLSYSSKDRPKTRQLASIFEKQGLKVWWDKNITPGKAFDRAISKALDEAFCIVVLWSPNSVESNWVLEEAYEGLQRKILIPTMIKSTRIPFGYRRIQYVDLTKWKGNTTTAAFQNLLESIKQLIPQPTKKNPAKKISISKKKPSPSKPTKIIRSLSGALDGKRIVFTGALSENRNAHAAKVKAVGATFVDSISGKTNYLVVGKKPGEAKLTAAEKFGVKKITEKKWLKMLNDAYRRNLLNKNIAFTGTLDLPRKELEQLAKKIGAKPQTKISKNTDFLIVGKKPGKVKLDFAKEHSTKVIDESTWNEILKSL